MIDSKMKFLDLFSGIGGFRLGLEMAGHECVGHVEIDKYANQSYRAIHQPKESEFFHEDITTITDESVRELRDRGIDIIAGGFPCQAFSIAGARRGFEDTRGTLFFDIARMARILRPKYLFLENVKGLLNHDNGDTFETILRALDELGYDAEWQMLNSKDYVPQNRERVFIIGHLRGSGGRKVFPIGGTDKPTDTEYKRVNSNMALCKLEKPYINGQFASMIGDDVTIRDIGCEIAGTVTARYYKGLGANSDNAVIIDANYYKGLDNHGARTGVMVKEETKQGVLLAPNNWGHKAGDGTITRKHTETEIHPALQANCGATQATYYKEPDVNQDNGFRIRRLTPKECWRLQGFPDWAFERAKAAGVSDSQLYKQAGNSVTVNVIHEIAKRLK